MFRLEVYRDGKINNIVMGWFDYTESYYESKYYCNVWRDKSYKIIEVDA